MIEPTLNMTYGGRPMSVLNTLILRRQEWLHEGYRDAVIATAITALQSIRAATKKRNPTKRIVLGVRIAVTERHDVHTAHTRGGARCYRMGPRDAAHKRSQRIEMGEHCVQLCPPGARAWRKCNIYHVKLTADQADRWPKQPVEFDVVAETQDGAMSYLEGRFKNIADREAGLGRHVLTLAMQRLSTRATQEEVGAAAKKSANRWLDINVSDGGDNFRVLIRDNLSYAMTAVNGGRAGVADALKRAANRIAGMINHKANLPLEEKLISPFPEVKRR